MIESFISGFWSMLYSVLQNLLSLILYPIYNLWISILGVLDIAYVPIAGLYNTGIDILSLVWNFLLNVFSWVPNLTFFAIICVYIVIFMLYIMLWLVRNIKDLVFRWV